MKKARPDYIAVDIVVTREGEHYCSWCPELDIASCARTPEEAIKSAGEAIELYLETLVAEGELEPTLKGKGIQPVRADETAIPRSFVSQLRIKLPTAERK